MPRAFFLLLFFSCVFLNHLFAQNEVSKDDIITSLRLVRNNLGAFSSPTAAQREKIDTIRMQINFAILNIDKDPDKFPKVYLQSLDQLAEFVKSNSQDATDKNKILDMVAKDLKLKFSKPPDQISSTAYTKLIKVSVMTQKGGKPVKNLRVHYNGLGYKINYSAPNYSFQNVTGPVQDQLVPGLYVLWATKDGDSGVLGQVITEIDPVKENKITIIVQ